MNTFTIERLSNLLYIYFRFRNLIIRCLVKSLLAGSTHNIITSKLNKRKIGPRVKMSICRLFYELFYLAIELVCLIIDMCTMAGLVNSVRVSSHALRSAIIYCSNVSIPVNHRDEG